MSTANVANDDTYFKSKDYNLKHHPKFTHKWKFCYHTHPQVFPNLY